MSEGKDDLGASAAEFAKRLRRTRDLRGLSQTQLSEEAGLTPAAISQIEAGDRLPAFKTLRRLAKALETSVGYLLDGEESVEMPPEYRALFKDLEELNDDGVRQLQDYAMFLRSQQREKKK